MESSERSIPLTKSVHVPYAIHILNSAYWSWDLPQWRPERLELADELKDCQGKDKYINDEDGNCSHDRSKS
jgi:hypothetical protein